MGPAASRHPGLEQTQPQQSAQDWNQCPAQDWGAQQQASGTEWGQQQPATQDWSQAQPQQSAQEWGQPQQSAQDWNQQQWQQGAVAPQPYPGQYTPSPAKGSPFDFSFKKLSLPGAAGLIFTLGVVAVGVEWLFSFIALLASGYEPPAIAVVNNLVGGLAGVLFKVLILRVLIEIGVAILQKKDETA